MQQLNATSEKIVNVLSNNESEIEANVENNTLFLRRRDWESIKTV
jgi:hypothetical protein